MENFTPIQGLIGGGLIGLATAIYLLGAGRISGISGLVESLMRPGDKGFALAVAYLAGLPLGALIVASAAPGLVPAVDIKPGLAVIALSGLLVGFGARIAGGCTSGHGLCGLPRLSLRSAVATGVFMSAVALTVFVARHVI